MTFTFFKMTRFDLDPIWPDRASKSYSEGCGFDCIVLIINLIVAGRTILVPSFNAIKTHGNAFALPKLFLLFCENLDKIYQEISCFTPFYPTFYPSYFCLLKGWKVPSEPLFLALKSIFLLLSLEKNNPAFLVIFAWVMWFSVDNWDWLFRG